MAYIYNNFLRPLASTDRNIQVIDGVGKIKYTINPFAVLDTMVINNLIKINLKNDKIIFLDFYTTDEAKIAIVELQKQIDFLIGKVPNVIDKEIENYVQNVAGSINYIHPTSGKLVIDGDLLPATNSVWNLGSPTFSWNILYTGTVNTTIVNTNQLNTDTLNLGGITISSASGSVLINSINLGSTASPVTIQSRDGILYISSTVSTGDIILGDNNDIYRNGESVLYRYSGTSSTPLQLPGEGYVVELVTQHRLGFKQGNILTAYNTIDSNYQEDDYVDDIDSYFVGEVTGYDFSSGLLEMVVSYSPSKGVTNNDGIVPTFSFWNIILTGKPGRISGGGATGPQGPTGSGFNAISSPASGRILTATGSSTTSAVAQTNFTYDGTTLALTASNFQITNGQSWHSLISNGNTTETVTIDLNNGNVQSYTLNANTTFSFSNAKSGGTYIIIVTQGASSFTASFSSAKWSGGSAPTITTTNGAVDVFTFIYDGANYYGSYVQNF